jgi:hypothetical protein
VEEIGHPASVVEVRRQTGAERFGEVVATTSMPSSQRRSAPAVHRRRSAAVLPSTMSMSTLASGSTSEVG